MSFRRHHSLYHVDCDVGHCCADLATANALARAHVNVRRAGGRLRLVNAAPELRELLDFLGIGDVLLGRGERQAEEREQTLGVEERREPDDPAV
jgi:hypothetical protein